MNRNPVLAVIVMAVVVFLAAGIADARGQSLPDGFYGKFRGAVAAPGNASGEFTVAIERMKGGFKVGWAPRIAVEFESAGRPGVFRDSADGEPMSGDPVYWARLAEGRLIVYAMQIDEHGGYTIQRYDYAPAGDGLDLAIRRIRLGGGPVEFKGRLDRYGG